MGNLNINRNTTDTNDNVRYSTNIPKIDYKGLTLLITGIVGIITLVWLLVLGVASLDCYFSDLYECKSVTYIFWGYVFLLFGVLIAVLAAAVNMTWQQSINMSYLSWRGVLTHRKDLSNFAPNIIEVAKASAVSEATAGMDNYSPSITKTSKDSGILAVDTPKVGLDVPIEFFGIDED